MRQLVLFWLFWATGAGFAAAENGRPAETPPGDFPGAQYIDSKGCVFVRAGRDWTAKLDDDGAPLCGFPPSRSAWAGGYAPPPPPSMAEIERDLTISLVEAEGAGLDLAAEAPVVASLSRGAAAAGPMAATPVRAGPRPPGTAGPVNAPAEQGPAAEIERALRADPTLAARMTAAADPNARLCDLLGLKPAANGGFAIGNDPTRGYCVGLAAQALPGRMAVPRALAGKIVASAPLAGKGTAPAPAVVSASTPMRAGDKPIGTRPAATGPKTAGGSAAKTGVLAKGAGTDMTGGKASGQANAASAAEALGERVPANARYVQIGQFNADGVMATIAAIRAMGYPVARQTKLDDHGQRVIVAGPFETRERLIAALDRLRRAGYAQAFAR